MATAKKAKKVTTRSRKAAVVEEGPRYQVLTDSYIDNVLYGPTQPAGDKVTYYGLPGSQLRPLNDEARARKQAVRDIRTKSDLGPDEKAEALRALSDEYNGVEEDDKWADGEDELDDTDPRPHNPLNTKPLSDADRVELEQHAAQTVADTAKAQSEDTNFTKVKLQGHLVETDVTKQGATPVLDSQGKTAKAAK
jgi:hypothetical protein